MLPFRYLVETILGGAVSYDTELREITAWVAGHEIIMVVEQEEIAVDGQIFSFGQAPVIVNDVTLVPLRAFEVLFAALEWDANSQRVIIYLHP